MIDSLERGEARKLSRLDDNVRLIVMQFSCSKKERMPISLKWIKKETDLESDERLAREDCGDGKLFMDSEKNTVSVFDFLDDLGDDGYELVDAFNQERLSEDLRYFYISRFVFARREYVRISEDFKNKRDIARAEFLKIAMEAMWRVKGFNNPFYEDSEKVLGEYAISLNMVARNPLVDNDGSPLYVWPKDEYGQKIIERDENSRKIGDAKIMVKPEYYLRVEDSRIVLCCGIVNTAQV